MNPSVTIRVNQLQVAYADLQALHIDSLEIDGGVFALLGHNGAGKSTFIKTILGLLDPQKGAVTISDSNGSLFVPEQDMAFCPENGAVFADISVEEYLKLWCRIKHGDSRYYQTVGSVYLERLTIAPLLRKRGRELSKGQRRRVQTALGFMSDPKLFLFDGPFDGLDVQRTNELMEIVEEERSRRAFLISSHRMDVMERISDAVIVLEGGALRSHGTVDEVCLSLAGHEEHSLTDAMRCHLKSIAA